MSKLNLEYYNKQAFSFIINEQTDGYLKGTIELSDELRTAFFEIQHEMDEKNGDWYLDDEGNRLADNLLFEKSPWSIVHLEKRTKIVQRFFNLETGEARFATQPFVQLSDWYCNK